MQVVYFAEEYFIRAVAIERAEEILPSLVAEARALVEMTKEEKTSILRKKLVKEFYTQEKRKWEGARNDPRLRRIQSSKANH